uniref:Ig-like domain-containing protein n=1 Tax=Mola mola TaxID=94237 RepID=A0A3Q3WYJ4_MOLML
SDLGLTYTSTNICSLKGSTVSISCTYRPESTTNDNTWDKNVFWYKDDHDLKSSRVENHSDGKKYTLTIKNLGESDSAVYKCGFTQSHNNSQNIAEPGVTLTVTGNCQGGGLLVALKVMCINMLLSR